MSVPAKSLAPSAGQTVGPFFAYGTVFPRMNEVAFPHSPGAVVLQGRVLDGAGDPVPDAMVEIWSADEDGSVPRARGTLRRDGLAFTGFGRAFTDDEGRFQFWTRNPGPPTGLGAGAGGAGAPFIAAIVYARGLPDKLHTRIYLPDDEAAIAADPFLSGLTAEERTTLIATRTADGHLEHDIRLQGERETVFLVY